MRGIYTLGHAREVAGAHEKLGDAIGIPYADWGKRCHEISFKLLESGRFGPGRVARGWAEGIRGQHSWLVLGRDVYSPAAVIVDGTLNHWRGHPELGIVVDKAENLTHMPHGQGSIWEAYRPPEPGDGEEIIELTPKAELSDEAQLFLSDDICGPLSRRGWSHLANGPMGMWPSAEIIAAMDDTPALRALVPIDILGMLTDRNPDGGYLVTSGKGVLPPA